MKDGKKQAACPASPVRRGPKPNRELELARRRFAIDMDIPENRQTIAEFAKREGVTPRQVQLAMSKHQAQVQQEWTARIIERLTDRNANDLPTPLERQAYTEARESRQEYRAQLDRKRAELKARRSKKKITPK
jgi:hypothetical protein